MFKRFIFLLLLPLKILVFTIACLSVMIIAPIVWVITGEPNAQPLESYIDSNFILWPLK